MERRRRLGDEIEPLAQDNKLFPPSAELLRTRSFNCEPISVDDLRMRSLIQLLARFGVPGLVPRGLVSPHCTVGGRGSGTDCESTSVDDAWPWSSSVEALLLLLLMLALLPTLLPTLLPALLMLTLLPTHALSLRDQPFMNALSRPTEGARSCPAAVSRGFRRV